MIAALVNATKFLSFVNYCDFYIIIIVISTRTKAPAPSDIIALKGYEATPDSYVLSNFSIPFWSYLVSS